MVLIAVGLDLRWKPSWMDEDDPDLRPTSYLRTGWKALLVVPMYLAWIVTMMVARTVAAFDRRAVTREQEPRTSRWWSGPGGR